MFLNKIGHSVSKGFNSFGHNVKSGVHDVGKGIKNTVHDVGHGISKGASSVYDDAKGLVTDTTHFISDTADQLLSPTTLILIVGGVVGVIILVNMVKK